MLTNPVKGPRRLWLAMSRCFHTSAAALASHVPGDRLSDECGLPEKESGGRGGKKNRLMQSNRSDLHHLSPATTHKR